MMVSAIILAIVPYIIKHYNQVVSDIINPLMPEFFFS